MSIDDLVREAQFLPEKLIDTLVCYARYLREDYSLTHTVEQHRAATENYRDRAEIAHKMLEAKKARIEKANSSDNNNQNEDDDKYKGWYRKPGLLKGKIFMADDFDEPLEDFNDVTIAAMNEFYDMKENPENYKRYSSFRDAVRDVLDA